MRLYVSRSVTWSPTWAAFLARLNWIPITDGEFAFGNFNSLRPAKGIVRILELLYALLAMIANSGRPVFGDCPVKENGSSKYRAIPLLRCSSKALSCKVHITWRTISTRPKLMSQDQNSIYTGITELTMTNTKSVVANSQIEALSTNLKETRVSHFFFVITLGDANDISFIIGSTYWTV